MKQKPGRRQPGILSLQGGEDVKTALQQLGVALTGLDESLAARGFPTRILDKPAVGLRSLDTRLKRWGLL